MTKCSVSTALVLILGVDVWWENRGGSLFQGWTRLQKISSVHHTARFGIRLRHSAGSSSIFINLSRSLPRSFTAHAFLFLPKCNIKISKCLYVLPFFPLSSILHLHSLMQSLCFPFHKGAQQQHSKPLFSTPTAELEACSRDMDGRLC